MVTTYYLAIAKSPFLQEIFPSFTIYFLTLASIAVPILTLIGYLHVKRSGAYGAEIDIQHEVNPYARNTLDNTDAILHQQNIFNNILIKLIKNEKLTKKESDYISQINDKLEEDKKDPEKTK